MPLDDPKELFVEVNEQDEVLGDIARGKAHDGSMAIHRSAYILVFNDKNQVLLQKRSQSKDTFPGYWAASVGGHVNKGQSYEEAAERELEEELGISVPFVEVGKAIFNVGIEVEYSKVYRAKHNKLPTEFDRDEVVEVRWFGVDEVVGLAKKNKLTPGAKQAMEMTGFLPLS